VHLAGGLGQRLALLEGHHPADLGRPLVQQPGRLEQDARPEVGSGVPPLREGLLGRGDGGVDIGRLGERDPADDFLGGRVDHVIPPAAGTLYRFTVDVQRDLWIFSRRITHW